MQEVLERTGLRAVTELFADEILDSLDIVIGRGLDGLDPLGVVKGKVIDQVVQDVFHHRGQWFQLRHRSLVSEALQPANFDQYAETDQPVFAESVAEIVDLVGVAPVGRGERS